MNRRNESERFFVRQERRNRQYQGFAKMVGKSGFWTYVLDFLAVFSARYAEPAGIILKLR